MSEISKLKLLVKKTRKRKASRIALDIDTADLLCDEIDALHAKIEELENAEPKHEITPKDEFPREIQIQGAKFTDS